MIDRLPELKKFTGQIIESTSDRDSNNNMSNQYQGENHPQAIDDDFFQDIKTVRECILVLNKNNHKIKELKRQYGTAVMETKEKEARNQMNKIVVENNDMQKKIKKKISDLEDRVKEAEKNEPDEPETKMKKNYCASLAKEVTEVLKKQQSIEDEFKTEMKKKIKRQIQHVEPNLDQQQIQEYVQNPDLAQEMLQKKIYGQASVTLNNRVSDIQDKYRDIKKLQVSVNQCVQLFNQLSNLVYAQGQKIDSIEANVAESKNYVEKGEKKLKEAKEHHKCSKKCMCFLIIGGLVLLIIVVIVVVSTNGS